MPRLPTTLINKAHLISPLVALLLRACRDIPSAQNELRWISEHVSRIYRNNHNTSYHSTSSAEKTLEYHEKLHLYRLCKSRSRGVPLQYILGTQPFGDLEIRCRRGVLIPRSETEAYTLELARILVDEIRSNGSSLTVKDPDNKHTSHDQDEGQQSKSKQHQPRPLRILDICSGTGCISLQLYAQLRRACPELDLEVVGLDISQKAIDLSRENIRFNKLHSHASNSGNRIQNGKPPRQSISYHRGDLFSPSEDIQQVLGIGSGPGSGSGSQGGQPPEEPVNLRVQEMETKSGWDLIISNPPYISSKSFSKNTTRSVQNFEPKLALVPGDDLLPPSPLPPTSTHTHLTNEENRSLVSSCQPEDIFYARILDLFLSGQKQRRPPKRILFEVADLEQASRVVEMMLSISISTTISCSENTNATIELWRDEPSSSSSSSSFGYYPEEAAEVAEEKEPKSVIISGREIPIRGSGNVRSVYFFAGPEIN
ncbi:S-adenosyl-L-methionine-dependent methyltransferase [Naviculisporaceae sp. PSN 640]